MPTTTIKAIRITPDKTVDEIEVSTLEEMQEVVGGLIEPIELHYFSRTAACRASFDMYVNEEYLYQYGQKDFNSIATDVCGLCGRVDIMLRTPILGPVLIVGPVVGDDSTSVNDAIRAIVKRVAREAGGTCTLKAEEKGVVLT